MAKVMTVAAESSPRDEPFCIGTTGKTNQMVCAARVAVSLRFKARRLRDDRVRQR